MCSIFECMFFCLTWAHALWWFCSLPQECVFHKCESRESFPFPSFILCSYLWSTERRRATGCGGLPQPHAVRGAGCWLRQGLYCSRLACLGFGAPPPKLKREGPRRLSDGAKLPFLWLVFLLSPLCSTSVLPWIPSPRLWLNTVGGRRWAVAVGPQEREVPVTCTAWFLPAKRYIYFFHWLRLTSQFNTRISSFLFYVFKVVHTLLTPPFFSRYLFDTQAAKKQTSALLTQTKRKQSPLSLPKRKASALLFSSDEEVGGEIYLLVRSRDG